MIKKRRENTKLERVDLTELNLTLKSYVSKEIKREERCGLLRIEYLILPDFGQGNIIEFYFEGVKVTISNFIFSSDFVFYNELKMDAFVLSFLVKGEVLLKLKGLNNEKTYEDKESIMTYVKKFKGEIKVYENKPFKEIRIEVSDAFLSKHDLNEVHEFKEKTNQDFILPIPHHMFSVLDALEMEYGEGLVQRIFLEAKVLEITALQIENYKNFSANKLSLINQKSLKKLFKLKHFLNENLNKNYSVSELAMKLGVSDSVLKVEFKRVFNTTISQYYLNQKMIKSKQLLQNTELPIYQIAEDVGYKNATHFSAAFKRFYNKTPKTCRSSIEN